MKLTTIAALLLVTATLPASAQSGPSPQEQMACRGDASKFCAEHIGKPPQSVVFYKNIGWPISRRKDWQAAEIQYVLQQYQLADLAGWRSPKPFSR